MAKLVFIAFIIFSSCSNEKPNVSDISMPSWGELKVRASAKGKLYLRQYYDTTYSIDSFVIWRTSLKSFWKNAASIGTFNCPDRTSDAEEMILKSSEVDSLLELMPVVRKFDVFKKSLELIPVLSIYMDTTYRVLKMDCDSGLVYR